MQANRRWWLYILRLEDEKFYVGITSKTPEIRMREHQNRVRVAYWTAKHRPTEVIYSKDLGIIEKERAEKIENKYVRKIMKEKGVNKVRGGDLTDTADYVIRFGRIYDKEAWGDAAYVLVMLVVLMVLAVDKWLVPFIPGGVR